MRFLLPTNLIVKSKHEEAGVGRARLKAKLAHMGA